MISLILIVDWFNAQLMLSDLLVGLAIATIVHLLKFVKQRHAISYQSAMIAMLLSSSITTLSVYASLYVRKIDDISELKQAWQMSEASAILFVAGIMALARMMD